jgi:phage/plasmid primase-like uncharacterized protein
MIALETQADLLGTVLATLGHAPTMIEPGKFHRFGPRKSGWIKLFTDGMGAVFGDYRQGISSHWSAREYQSATELESMRSQIRQATMEREAAQRMQWAKTAERNARLWATSVSAGDAVRSYLAQRGLGGWNIPSCIREHPNLAYWHTDDNGEIQLLGRFPTMLAPIVRDGKLIAIHRTYLTDGKKAEVPTPKKLTAAAGPLAGACIPLAVPRCGVLGIAEGIETAAAASLGSGLPVVAAYCANALSGFHWPRGIDRLLIFADNDLAGQQAATALAQRANKAGIDNKTLTPSRPGADWADVWLEGK